MKSQTIQPIRPENTKTSPVLRIEVLGDTAASPCVLSGDIVDRLHSQAVAKELTLLEHIETVLRQTAGGEGY